MANARTRIPINHLSFMGYGYELENDNRPVAENLSDDFFGFAEDSDHGSPAMSIDEECDEEDQEEEKGNDRNGEDDKNFWENQQQLLQATLCRSSPLESKMRSITKETIKELQMAGTICGCGRPMASGCRKCLMSTISGRLRNAGFDSAICKSKWRSCPDIPSGEHTFLDVIDKSSSKRGEVRVIIELNFRAEFEIAKASEEYNQLVKRLPEVFVGKIERLKTAIKILCSAAKKCMKEKKMHLGPWRKHRYMQAKWLSNRCERSTSMPAVLSMESYSGRLPKPRQSMLTVDLLEMLPNMHCVALQLQLCDC